MAITAGSGTLVDTQIPTGGDHRQVVVLGDPTTISGIATVANNGLYVNLNGQVFPSSTGQNSTTQLAASATFTGTIETILNHTSAQIEVTSDQPFTLSIDQFIDAGGTRLSSTDTYTRAAGVPFNENITLPGNYFRIRVQNTGASTTTTFQSDVTFGIMQTTPRGPTNLSNNRVGIMEINGTAASVNSGTVDAGTLRVVLPTNQSAVATTPAGAAANGSAVTGNPILVGGSDGTNARSLATDTSGRLVTVPPDTSAAISITANATPGGSITGLTGSGVAMIQVTSVGTGGVVQVQLTVDGTNWVNITGSNQIINNATGAYVASGNINATGMYMIDVSGATGVRVITTVLTAGTFTGSIRAVTGAGGSTLINGTPAVTQSGTWTVGVTGYPTAAASADALANPTVTQVGAANLVYNGTTWDRLRTASADAQAVTGIMAAGDERYNGATWDRARNNWNTTTGDTGTKTGSFTGATVTNYDARGAYITVLCGTVSGTSPTLVAQLQWSPDGAGTNWLNIGPATTAITATGNTATIAVYPANLSQAAGGTPANLTTGATATTAINAPLPRTWRLNYTITGTTPSFAITAVYVNYIN